MKGLSLKDLSLSPEESKEIAKLLAKKKRGIKDYESTSNDRLLSALISSKPVRKDKKLKFLKATIGGIESEFKKSKHKLSKPIRDEIRRNIYEIKNRKNLFTLGTKKIKRPLDELEISLSRTRKYHDYDDVEYKGIKDTEGLFDLPIDKDYSKPVILNTALNNNYMEYKSKGDKDKILTIDEYLDMIRLYLVDMINDHKTKSEWKIQLTMAINLISFKPDFVETGIMYTKSNRIEIMVGSDTNEVIEELFKSLLQRYKKELEEKMRGSEFVFDGVNALYYDLNKISLIRSKLYTDSPEWIKNKKATTNPKNDDDKCFQYALIKL